MPRRRRPASAAERSSPPRPRRLGSSRERPRIGSHLTHPDMHELVVRKAQDPERWIKGMRRLWQRTQELLSD